MMGLVNPGMAMEWWRHKRQDYPHHVRTVMNEPKPEQVDEVLYGAFIRAPMPTKGYTMWGFIDAAGAERFKMDFAKSLDAGGQ
jgi:hypothetical protein